MNRFALPVILCLLAVAAGAGPAPREAREVVVRGGRALSDLLASATAKALRGEGRQRPVAIVVDVTPHTMAHRGRLEEALEALGDRVRRLDGKWSIAPLSGKLSAPVQHPSALAVSISAVLARETSEVNTLRALSRTLAPFTDRGGIVVYLADWRFEDDHGLEPFIAKLRSRGQTLSVIGSEAAYGRPWTDAFWPDRRIIPDDNYEPSIGRNPFAAGDPAAPWHGGDTAYPALPWHFAVVPWQMEFMLKWSELDEQTADGEDRLLPEDLEERLRRLELEDAGAYAYPLSSSWGPYGLMRIAAETGGHYYLHSFNPRGRTDLTYDYSRTNLFPPDLRSRAEILADLRRNPVASAMAGAWETIGNEQLGLAAVTSPVAGRGARTAEMEYAGRVGCGCLTWRDSAEHQACLKGLRKHLEAARTALGFLDRALAAPPPGAGVRARYRADAELFRHTLSVLVFQLGEAIAAAETVSPRAWDEPDIYPSLDAVVWIAPGGDPEAQRVSRQAKLFHREEGEGVLEARKEHLRRYGGTPMGEIVARNSVVTYELIEVVLRRADPRSKRPGLTPSESGAEGRPTPEPRTGGSGAGGPGTGR